MPKPLIFIVFGILLVIIMLSSLPTSVFMSKSTLWTARMVEAANTYKYTPKLWNDEEDRANYITEAKCIIVGRQRFTEDTVFIISAQSGTMFESSDGEIIEMMFAMPADAAMLQATDK